jgi:hypothetical protein
MFTVKSLVTARPGRHLDEKGLYLEVGKDGATKRWLYRFTSPVTFKVTEAGLGVFPVVGLADARAKAADMRAAIAKGVDPIIAKRETRAADIAKREAARTLADAVAAYQKAFVTKGRWVIEKMALLKRHLPILLAQPLSEIATKDVLPALAPVQAATPKTAARAQIVLSTIFDYAIAMGMHTGTNPASSHVFPVLSAAAATRCSASNDAIRPSPELLCPSASQSFCQPPVPAMVDLNLRSQPRGVAGRMG